MMYRTTMLVCISACLFILYGCVFNISGKINENFQIEKLENDKSELIYKNDDGYMFTVLTGDIVSYKVCGQKIIIKLKPNEYGENINDVFFEYYAVNINGDYSHTSPDVSSEEVYNNCSK